MAKGKNVLTTGDVARICNVAPRTVSKWFDTGQLKGYRIPGSKDRRIPLNELIRFMQANNMPMESLPTGRIRVLMVDGSDQGGGNGSLHHGGGSEVRAGDRAPRERDREATGPAQAAFSVAERSLRARPARGRLLD